MEIMSFTPDPVRNGTVNIRAIPFKRVRGGDDRKI